MRKESEDRVLQKVADLTRLTEGNHRKSVVLLVTAELGVEAQRWSPVLKGLGLAENNADARATYLFLLMGIAAELLDKEIS